MRIRLRICSVAALALFTVLVFSPAVRAEPEIDPFAFGFIKCERYYANYEVNADGTYTETRQSAWHVLGEQGIEAANSDSLSYRAQLQDAEVLEAYTLK